MPWPLNIDGDEFKPIPESWIAHGIDEGGGEPRIYAVSAAAVTPKLLRLRYAHPQTEEVAVYTVGATLNASGDGYLPANLRDKGSEWARSLVPHSATEPTGPMRAPEVEHFEELWDGRIPEIERQKRAVADGGEP